MGCISNYHGAMSVTSHAWIVNIVRMHARTTKLELNFPGTRLWETDLLGRWACFMFSLVSTSKQVLALLPLLWVCLSPSMLPLLWVCLSPYAAIVVGVASVAIGSWLFTKHIPASFKARVLTGLGVDGWGG